MSAVSAQGYHSDDNQKLEEQRAHQPSMEEILASIRRIIADDQVLPLSLRPTLAPPPRIAEKKATVLPIWSSTPQPQSRAPVHAVADPPAPVASAPPLRNEQPAPAPAEPLAMAADFEPEHFVETSHQAISQASAFDDMAAFSDPEPEPSIEPAHEHFNVHDFTPHVASMREEPAMTDHVHADPRGHGEALVSHETSASVTSSFNALAASMMMQNLPPVEDMARDLLRPMLKAWLDDNLPVLVERLVRAEIERVARGGR